MILQLWNSRGGDDFMPLLIGFLLAVPALLFSLCFHEFSHALAAYKLGDPTAKNQGRLTLNPMRHLNPLGTAAMLLFGFGWARPVPIDARYFKKPKFGMALAAAAGPLSNLALTLISTLAAKLMFLASAHIVSYNASFAFELVSYMFYIMAVINVTLATFNLLPIPPLDGSRLLLVFLPEKTYFSLMKYEWILSVAIFAMLMFGIIPIGLIADGVFWLFDHLWSLIPGLPLLKG